ncbi:hypothetical protein [Streptomyces sennicomposti]
MDLPVHRIEADFLAPDQLLLLRPDQVVAWRGTDPATATAALAGLLAGSRAAPGARERAGHATPGVGERTG